MLNMPETGLTQGQMAEIEAIKKQWLDEAEPYLNNPPPGGAVLDGPDSTALAEIQDKYKKRIQEVIKASE